MLRHVFGRQISIVLIMLGLLIGCGGGGDSSDLGGNETTSYTVSGRAQKGPFLQGSLITIYELDESFNQTGTAFQTEMLNDLGEYTLPVNLSSRYIELYVNGFFFNEIQGDVYSVELTLSAIADITDSSSININLLTTLARPRIIELASSGQSFRDAESQANEEILHMLGFEYENTGLFKNMDMLHDGDDNALLLAATSVIMQMAVKHDSLYTVDLVPALEDILTAIKNDIKEDGELNDPFFIDLIQEAIATVDMAAIRVNLEEEYKNLTQIVIPEFESLVNKNVLFPSSEFAGTYSLRIADWPEIGWNMDLELTIHNQFYMTGTAVEDQFGFIHTIVDGSINDDGEFTFHLFVNVASIICDGVGTISPDRTVNGTLTDSTGSSSQVGIITSY